VIAIQISYEQYFGLASFSWLQPGSAFWFATSRGIGKLHYVRLHFNVLEGPTTLSIKAQDQLVVLHDSFLMCDGE